MTILLRSSVTLRSG